MQMKQPAKQLLILQSSSLMYHDYQTSQVSWRLNGLKTFSIKHEQVHLLRKIKSTIVSQQHPLLPDTKSTFN